MELIEIVKRTIDVSERGNKVRVIVQGFQGLDECRKFLDLLDEFIQGCDEKLRGQTRLPT
jgi:gamma-glutamylcysteine synthetase